MSNNHIIVSIGKFYYKDCKHLKNVLLVVGNACFKCLHYIMV